MPKDWLTAFHFSVGTKFEVGGVCIEFSICLYMRTCVCCVCACVCKEARDQRQVSSSIIPQPILRLFLLLNPEVHDSPDWLASKLEDLPVSPSPLLLGLQMYATMPAFAWVLGIQTPTLLLVQWQPFYLSSYLLSLISGK